MAPPPIKHRVYVMSQMDTDFSNGQGDSVAKCHSNPRILHIFCVATLFFSSGTLLPQRLITVVFTEC